MSKDPLPSNPPCPSVHLNSSLGAATAPLVGAIFNALEKDMPHNAPRFRRVRSTCQNGATVPTPTLPHACLIEATAVPERLVTITRLGFATVGREQRLAEAGTCLRAGIAMIVCDRRHDMPRCVRRCLDDLPLGRGDALRGRDSSGSARRKLLAHREAERAWMGRDPGDGSPRLGHHLRHRRPGAERVARKRDIDAARKRPV
jgi:hypothetical protein